MKKVIAVLLMFVMFSQLVFADSRWGSTQEESARLKRNAVSWIVAGVGFLAMGGVFQGMVVKEKDDADYASHVLEASYGPNNGYKNKMMLMDYQNHYLGELEKHKERQGVYEGVSWFSFGIGTAFTAIGITKLYRRHKWLQSVCVEPEEDGVRLAYQLKF